MKKKHLKFYSLIGLILISLVVYLFTTSQTSNSSIVANEVLDGLKVTYIDVGQADSILIQVDNESMLIDAGNTGDGEKIISTLKDNNVNELKYVVGTHAHEDHIGAMNDVIKEFKIDHFYMPDVLADTKTFENVLDELAIKNIKYEVPTIGDTYNLGNAKLEVLYVGKDLDNLNNDSIILMLTYKDIKFLFTGDATKTIEKKLIKKDIKADVLKVAHHGASSSTNDLFLAVVKPSYAVISVGKNNKYNHPSKKTLKRLNNYNVNVLRTDELGTIIITSDGKKINVGSNK